MFEWENKCSIGKEIRATFSKDEHLEKCFKVQIIAVQGSMVVINTGASTFQVNASKVRRYLDTGSGRTSSFARANRSTCAMAFF